MTIPSQYVGTWQITHMSTWDMDFVDLDSPGHITIKKNRGGQFCFGAVQAEIDCRVEKLGDKEQLGFSFTGWDEDNEMSGRGTASVDGKKMSGWFGFHQGDDSTFEAEKKK